MEKMEENNLNKTNNQQNQQNIQIKSKPVEKWLVQQILNSNNLHPTKDWNEQFQQDLHRTLLNYEEQDTKRLGQVLGVAVLGLVGFAVTIPIIGLIVGSVLGAVLGGYAGKRIKRKRTRNKNLIHFDLFMINCACYLVVIVDEIERNKGSIKLNNFRFKIQKTLKEYRGVDIYHRLSKPRQKGFKSEIVRLLKALQNHEAFRALYLIYKMAKTLVKETENNRTSQQIYDIQYMVVNVMKPAISMMNICMEELNFDQKYILLKYEKFVLSYEVLKIIDNLHPDFHFCQDEFLEKLEKEVTIHDIKDAFQGFDLEQMIQENELQKQQQPNDQNQKEPNNIISLIQMQMQYVEECSAKKRENAKNGLWDKNEEGQQNQQFSEFGIQNKQNNINQQKIQENPHKNNNNNNSYSSYDSDEIPNKELEEADKPRGNEHSLSINKNQKNHYLNNQNTIDQDSIEITFHQNLQEEIPEDKQLNIQESGEVHFQREQTSIGKKLVLQQLDQKDIPKQENIDECISTQSRQRQPSEINHQQFSSKTEILQENDEEKKPENRETQQKSFSHNPKGYEFIKCPTSKVDSKYTNSRLSYIDINNKNIVIEEQKQENEQQEQDQQQNQDVQQQQTPVENNNNNDNEKNKDNQIIDVNLDGSNKPHCKDDNEEPGKIEIHSEKLNIKIKDKEIEIKLENLMKSYKQTVEEGKWNKVIGKPEITIYKKMDLESAAVMVRADSTILNATPQQVFELIYDDKLRGQWDKVLLGFTQLEKYDENSDLIYSYVDPGFGVSRRDWVQKRYYKKDFPEKGQITICYFSTEHPQYPAKKNTIRADSLIAGYIITPVGNNSSLFILSCNDIKGLIPKYVVNFVAARAPKDWIISLQKQIDKGKKKKK